VVRHKTATTPIVSARQNRVELLESPVALDAEPKADAGKRTVTGARARVDMDDSRFHDLRHAGQTLAGFDGGNSEGSMRRHGYVSLAVSNRYLHAVEGRDAEIAAALSVLATNGDAAKLPKTIVVKH
jgi:hypothetical protein